MTRGYAADKIGFFFLGLAFTFALSCSNEDLIQEKNAKEKSHAERADAAQLYSGYHRLLLTWPNSDPELATVKAYWNERQDSLVQEIESGSDKVEINITDLTEGSYILEILALNKEGRGSGKVIREGYVYGESFLASVTDRVLRNLTLYENGNLEIEWAAHENPAVIGSEVSYIDANGEPHTKYTAVSEAITVIPNMPLVNKGSIKYRTVYLPELSLDSLYGKFRSIEYVNRKGVFESLEGWKFRIKVMAEIQTIEDHGGPMAFKEKMDEALTEASRRFQVEGLNGAGGNKIHFYMSEMISFEGMSKQYRYVRGVDDSSFDILLIVNDHDGPDDLAWGWLREPYLTLGHNYEGLFGPKAIDALVHELGHARGMYDLYLGEVPEVANNPISNQSFESKKGIMNYPYGETQWSEFSRFIINKSAGNKVAEPYWNYFPPEFRVSIHNQDGSPASNAKLNFFPVFGNSNAVRSNDVIKYRATTDDSGTYVFPDNPYAIDGDITNNVFNYLVQIEYEGQKEFRWMPMDDALIAGSKGKVFHFQVILDDRS